MHYYFFTLFIFGISGCQNLNSGSEKNNTFSGYESTEENNKGKAVSSETHENDSSQDYSKLTHNSYKGKAYQMLSANKPEFTNRQKKNTKAFEKYSKLDSLGRCGVAFANICKELMPDSERTGIGMIKPSGWQTAKYNGIVDGNYLYNRCHLIGFQLAGENANEKNLITGTRYMNVEGMLPFENQIADYVDRTNNHVLYRVTPVFKGDNLVAEGVKMEAYSVEDKGKGVCFNVFVYNVQPQITIDYSNGESSLSSDNEKIEEKTDLNNGIKSSENNKSKTQEYILNTNTKKFHLPSCSSVSETLNKNKKSYKGSRKELIDGGYEPCGRCKP